MVNKYDWKKGYRRARTLRLGAALGAPRRGGGIGGPLAPGGGGGGGGIPPPSGGGGRGIPLSPLSRAELDLDLGLTGEVIMLEMSDLNLSSDLPLPLPILEPF